MCANLLSLSLLFDVFVAGLNQGQFVSACKQFLIVDVHLCPRNHLENVEKLFLTKSNQLLKLLCARFLVVRRLMIHCGPHKQICTLRKRLQILLVLEGHLRRWCCDLLRLSDRRYEIVVRREL